MAAEPQRGCGYRRIGGLYLVGGGIGVPCDRLPLLLDVCPTCGAGIHRARGWTWVDVNKLVQGPHKTGPHKIHVTDDPNSDFVSVYDVCPETGCIFCREPALMGRAGLLWIGEQFYPTPDLFLAEGRALGFSRRIKAVPRGFKIGETYVLLAHSKAVRIEVPRRGFPADENGVLLSATEYEMKPGVVYVWLPQRIEKIFSEKDKGSEAVEEVQKRGIVPVFLPSDDPDHQGSLFEKEKE